MRKLVFCLFLFGFIFSGCKKKPEAPPTPPDEDLQVVIVFSTQSQSVSLLKSGATEAEEKIDKIILFGVDDQSNVVAYPAITGSQLTEALGGGMKLTISKKVKSLYAIANPSVALENATPANVTALMDLRGVFGTAPASPFLMGGKGDINNSSANIQLIRAVAKIEITGNNDFDIKMVTVQNTPNQGFVFKQTTFSVPSSFGRTNYATVTSATPILYVAESPGGNPATFLVTGVFDGIQASYLITIQVDGVPVDIVRNTHYQVGVTPITESEYDVTIAIPDWMDRKTDDHEIPYEDFN